MNISLSKSLNNIKFLLYENDDENLLKSSIESLIKLLSEKWNSIPKVLVNLNQEFSGAYLLSYSIDVNGNYFHISTKGDNLGQMAENLKNKLFNI